MISFYCRTKIISGSGALEAIRDLAPQRLLVVADPYFVGNGTAGRIAAMARESAVFGDVRPDPSVELAAEGVALIRSFEPDTVVALGGGSALDCAKAMVYFAGSGAQLVAVPTTSGSGSEVTDFAILTHGGTKHPLVDPVLQPSVAILDDDLLQDLPRSLIADAGFDVLAHALEAIGGKNAGPITDALARDAFCAVCTALPASFAGDRRARLPMHTAATMAGMAFNRAGLGLCHAMAHVLGGQYHVPHGRLNAVLLPAVLEANAPAAGSRYGALARAAGLGGAADTVAVRNLKNALIRLRRDLGLPATLAEAGIQAGQLRQDRPQLIAAVLEDPCCATNPQPVTRELVAQVLDEVTGRG